MAAISKTDIEAIKTEIEKLRMRVMALRVKCEDRCEELEDALTTKDENEYEQHDNIANTLDDVECSFGVIKDGLDAVVKTL